MIRVEFVCPSCLAVIPAPLSLVGESAPCPKCGAYISPWSRPPGATPPPIPPIPPAHLDDPAAPAGSRTVILAVAGIGLLLIGLVIGLSIPRGGGTTRDESGHPVAKNPGSGATSAAVTAAPEGWTHREMEDYLRRMGLSFKPLRTNHRAFSGPAVIFAREGTAAAVDEKAARAAYDKRLPEVVYCQIRQTPQEAREAAAIDAGFSTGRFLFTGHPEALAAIRGAFR